MSNSDTIVYHETVRKIGDLAKSFLPSTDLESPFVVYDKVAHTRILDGVTGPQLVKKERFPFDTTVDM